ncbi:MAG TPA: DNA polymerase I [Planctomycetota bacterium]|nr:DNA polymerase I [Planctomycetota bacterium]
MKRLFLVDATALAYRGHFALLRNPLTNTKGLNTSAAKVFTDKILEILDKERPDLIALAFDHPTPTFRHARFAEYKATREKMPEEMHDALDSIDRIVAGLGLPVVSIPGFEADDVIGTLARRAEARGLEVMMVTGDKDFAQLVTDHVKIWNPFALGHRPSGGHVEILGPKEVEAKFGVKPERIRDLLALMGDTSDNIPGVPAVGEKTARSLLERFGSLDEVLAHASEVEQKRVRENLIAHSGDARLSYELVTIVTDAPVGVEPTELTPRTPDRTALFPVFQELEFRDLSRRFSVDASSDPHVHKVASTPEQVDQLVRDLEQAEEIAFDLETTSLKPLEADIVGMSFSWKPNEATYLPAREVKAKGATFSLFAFELDFKEQLEKVRKVLEDPARKKGGQNVKYDMLVLSRYGVEVRGITFDTLLESYLLDPSARQRNLDELALRYLNYKKIPTESVIGAAGKKQRTMDNSPEREVAAYASEDADITLRLHRLFGRQVEEQGLGELYRTVELPLMHVLLKMEKRGVKVETDMLKGLADEFATRLAAIEKECWALAGETFNIESPKQLAQILFDKLEIDKKAGVRAKKTMTGAASTDIEVLEKLAEHHDLPAKILEHRSFQKLKGTYVDALPQLVNKKTGRVHTSFNQAVAATGRLSSSDPNLQNIPIRTPEGKRIRGAFVAGEPGWLMLSADYSQIELRLLAHLSKDEGLLAAFRAGEDIHRATAARIFDKKPDEVTSELRGRAKVINFGIVYGMGAARLARETGMPYGEAIDFIKGYFDKYPAVKAYLDSQIEHARKHGYVATVLGRKRLLPEIWSSNRQLQMTAERIATNTPIQGSAADLIKVAMIKLDARLEREKFPAHMLLQVHDELVFEVEEKRVQELADMVRHEMSTAVELTVPLKVDVGWGRSWLDAH